MLKIIYGDVGAGKSTYMASEIKKDIKNGIRSYLVVPEQQAVICEKKMSEILPPSAPLTFEVSNFTRLANTVFRSLGGLCYNYADSSVKFLIMWQTLKMLQPLLKEKSSFLTDVRSVKKYLSYIKELKMLKITPSMLEGASREVKSRTLSDRLTDLSLVSGTYESLLKNEYSDSDGDLDRLAEILSENDFFRGSKIYIDGFMSFTGQQYEIFERLVMQSDVTIALYRDFGNKKMCFSEVNFFAKNILSIARKHSVEVEICELKENKRCISELLKFVSDNIFTYSFGSAKFIGERDGSLRIEECRDLHNECEVVAAAIKNGVFEGGRYSDYAVITADTSAYAGVIDDVFGKYEIPHFVSAKRDISTFDAIKFINSAYNTVLNGYRDEDVITHLKCQLSGISERDADIFEIYVSKWNISGKRFLEEEWMMNPDGYTDRKNETSDEILKTVNEVKEKLLSPLEVLLELKGRGSVGVETHARVLVKFLQNADTERKLYERASEYKKNGDAENSEYYSRLWKQICNVLDRLVTTLKGDETQISMKDFAELLRVMFAQTSLGRIPPSPDAVIIGNADTVRADGVLHVFMVGVNDGEFPQKASDRGVFSEADREELASCGIGVEPDIEERYERALFCFYKAMLTAERCLTITYHTSDLSGKGTSPSFAVQRIREVSNGAEVFSDSAHRDVFSLMYTRESVSPLLPYVKSKKLRRDIAEYALDSFSAITEGNEKIAVSSENTDMIFGDRMYLTQSRIENFAKCPFSYYCNYVLKLDPSKPVSFDPSSVGSFMHGVLERIFLLLEKENKSLAEIEEPELSLLIEKACRGYVDSIIPTQSKKTARLAYLFKRLASRASIIVSELREEFAYSSFRPVYFELKIGKNGIPPVEFVLSDGTRASIYGSVDRVDACEINGKTYIRVVDYKTGKKQFSRDDIEKGKNLQLLIYLYSIVSGDNRRFFSKIGDGELMPAAALYLSSVTAQAKLDTPAEDGAAVAGAVKKLIGDSRNGIVIDDLDVRAGLDSSEGEKFTPKGKSLVSVPDMNEIFADISSVITEIAAKMRSGDAHIPTKRQLEEEDACKYCDMKYVCRSAVNKGQ